MISQGMPATNKGAERKKAMIEAARSVFIEAGFEGATLDKIIELSGGSRSSLYHHFGDKEGLFVAVVNETIEAIFSEMVPLDSSASLEEVLSLHGRYFLKSILDPQTLSLFRLIVAEIERFPKLGELFYQVGPEKTYQTVARSLRQMPELAQYSDSFLYRFSCHFLEMTKGELFMKALCIKDFSASPESIEESLRLSVSLMLCLLTHHNLNIL